MTFWIVLTVMVLSAAVGVVVILIRRGGWLDRRTPDGAMVPAEGVHPLGERVMLILTFALAAVVALGAAGLYAVRSRPAPPSSMAAAASPEAALAGADIPALIGQMEAQLQRTPGDGEGWRMLGWAYFQTERFVDAAGAYGRAAALEPANAGHQSARGEALVQAAAGQVTPEAASAFRSALQLDPADPRARYFLGMAMDQAGNHVGAMNAWIELINSAPAGAPWVAEVRAFVEGQARTRGEDISDRLEPAPTGSAAAMVAAPGPTAAQVADAQTMTAGDRQGMIRGMVEGLETRLRAAPQDRDGWIRLMRARMVLNESAAATSAWREARTAFAGSASDQAAIDAAARELAVPGA
jgi:cytochrome c-type biogenesis protein CcmH